MNNQTTAYYTFDRLPMGELYHAPLVEESIPTVSFGGK